MSPSPENRAASAPGGEERVEAEPTGGSEPEATGGVEPEPTGGAEPEPTGGAEPQASIRAEAEADVKTEAERPTRGHRHSEHAKSRGERLLEWLLPGTSSAGAIYGMLAIGALLAAESGLRETYPATVGSAALTLALYWLAHTYADLLGDRLRTHERLTATSLGRNLLHDWPIVRGGAVPLLVLVVCWVAGVGQETAVTVDLWTTVGILVAYELLAGLRAKARPAELVLEGCVGAAMGLGILALRVILH